MSWLFSTIPYILAAGTIALGLFTLVKEWEEYKNSRLRMAVIIVLVIVGALTFVSLYRDNQEKRKAARDSDYLKGQLQDTNKQVQDSREKLTSIQKGQDEAKSKAQRAEEQFNKQLRISDTVSRELSLVRHELELERTPVNRAMLEWRTAIPVETPCLKAYVDDARKASTVEQGIVHITLGSPKFPDNCEEQLSGLFGSISLNVVFCKPCRKVMNPLDPSEPAFMAPEGGLQKIQFAGRVPEGYWLFSVSGSALTPPGRTVGFHEKTNSIYIRFETALREEDLRTPTGTRLSLGDISGGTFAFQLNLDRYPMRSPTVIPKLHTVSFNLNNWLFGFVESGPRGPLGEVPFQRSIFVGGDIRPAVRYIGHAPVFKKIE